MIAAGAVTGLAAAARGGQRGPSGSSLSSRDRRSNRARACTTRLGADAQPRPGNTASTGLCSRRFAPGGFDPQPRPCNGGSSASTAALSANKAEAADSKGSSATWRSASLMTVPRKLWR